MLFVRYFPDFRPLFNVIFHSEKNYTNLYGLVVKGRMNYIGERISTYLMKHSLVVSSDIQIVYIVHVKLYQRHEKHL